MKSPMSSVTGDLWNVANMGVNCIHVRVTLANGTDICTYLTVKGHY